MIAELLRWFGARHGAGGQRQPVRASQARRPAFGHSPDALLGCGRERQARRLHLRPGQVRFLGKVGEIAIPPSESRYIELPRNEQEFRGFDRNPYLAAFRAGNLDFLLVRVHFYFGSEKGETSKRDMNRRSLETYAVARWADLRRRRANAFTRNIIAIGARTSGRTAVTTTTSTTSATHISDHRLLWAELTV